MNEKETSILLSALFLVVSILYIVFTVRGKRIKKAAGLPHWSDRDPAPYTRSLFLAGAIALAAIFYGGLMIYVTFFV